VINQRVPARVIKPEIGPPNRPGMPWVIAISPRGEHVLAQAGDMWPIADRPTQPGLASGAVDAKWQVRCPGCGQVTYSLPTQPYLVTTAEGEDKLMPGYSFTGDASRPETLCLAEEVNFVPCGCGRFRLHNGVWRHQTSESVILP
jgi:hypothetical protein